MREINDTTIEGYNFQEITKFVLNKSIDGETIVDAIIIDSSSASAISRGISNSSKGKPLVESRFVEGTLTLSLDKNNYDILVTANEEYTHSEKIKGNKVDDLFTFIGLGEGARYLVEV